MKTKYLKISLFIISIFILTSISFPNKVEEVLKGKNSSDLRISIKNMPADIQKKAIKVLLEENGNNAMLQAKQIIMDSSDPSISAYMKIVIADYHLLNNNFINAQIQLDEAKDIAPEITQTKYYKLIASRISNLLYKTNPKKARKDISFLSFNDNIIKEKAKKDNKNININTPTKALYHIQVGAFSRLTSSKQLAEFYLKNGYYVEVVEKQTPDKILYIVYIGNYNSYSEANQSLIKFKNEFQTTGFIVKDED